MFDNLDDDEDYDIAPEFNFHDFVYDGNPEAEPEPEQTEEPAAEVTPEEIPQEQQFEYPDYIGDEWRPPADADPTWYQEKYQSLHKLLSGDELASKLTEAYKDKLLQEEQSIENFKDLYKAHSEGNVAYLRRHFPDELAKAGINPVLTEAEIDASIEAHLKEEFGDNYEEIFDQKQIIRPTSLSAKIYNRSQQLVQFYQEENSRRETLVQKPAEQQQAVPLDFDKLYEDFTNEMSRDEFNTMVETIKSTYPKWTLRDLRHVLTYDDDIAKAREEGARLERERLTKELRSTGNAQPISRAARKEVEEEEPDPIYGRSFNDIVRNMINSN